MGISNHKGYSKTYRTGSKMETTTTTQATTTTPQEKGNKMTRTEIATIHNWTLTSRDYDDHQDYIIQVDEQRPLINLYVEATLDFKAKRPVYDVSFIPVSRQLTLEEAVEYADLVQKALQAAITFKHLIEAAEAIKEEATV